MAKRRRTTQKQRVASRRNLVKARKKRNRRLAIGVGVGVLAVGVGAGVIYGKKLRGHPRKMTVSKPKPKQKPKVQASTGSRTAHELHNMYRANQRSVIGKKISGWNSMNSTQQAIMGETWVHRGFKISKEGTLSLG